MKPIDYLRFVPATIFCTASVVGWLLGKPDYEGFVMAGIGCYFVALAAMK